MQGLVWAYRGGMVTILNTSFARPRAAAMLLGCTMLTGIPSVALAQGAPATAQPGAAAQQQVAPAPSATPVERTIRSLVETARTLCRDVEEAAA